MSLETTKNGTIVRDYTSGHAVKEYIQEELMPKAYPNIPIGKLSLGFSGVINEYVSQAIEDAYASASLMMNEAFITRAVLPNSIYSEASIYNMGYTFAHPSTCSFGLQIWIPDIIKYATKISNLNVYRYYLDKDTTVILSDNRYRLDYDIIIDYQFIDGQKVFSVYYDIDESNSISEIKSKYIKYQVTAIDWLILFLDLKEFERKVITKPITDNLVTVNSDIELKWTRQIAGLDLIYITPNGKRQKMELRNEYTKAIIDPFAWYRFETDNIIKLSFSNNSGYFSPAFNSKVEATIYTCDGKSVNTTDYNNKAGVPVQKTGKRFSYNAGTKMVALCSSTSINGLDKGDIESLRDDVIYARNTANVLSDANDLQLWFDRYANKYDTKCKFFKRRDDPSGKVFSQFVTISKDNYIFPTNTLSIVVNQNQFDYVNNDPSGENKEFIIKPGHLWEYDGDSRDTVKMVEGVDGLAMVTDKTLPVMGTNRPFMFVNPFYLKIYKNPTISMNYNYLIDDTSWPEDLYSNSDAFYQFQLATLSIQRSLSSKDKNKYKISVICVPTINSSKDIKYIEDIGEEYLALNNVRLILVTRSSLVGETGYIEMIPTEIRVGGSILFETEFIVLDNIQSDSTIEIDLDNTPNMKSLISYGLYKDKVIIDSSETSFHFICLMRDTKGRMTTNLFNNSDYDGYMITNRFTNNSRDLSLYKPLSMMKSNIEFSGENNNYQIKASLIPFLKYDTPLDTEKMNYFVNAFDQLYNAMIPALDKLKDNSTIDFKLYNTYGRSNNYYIGPKDGSVTLWDSDILLDNVYVKIKFVLSVYDRSLYTQTTQAIINEIKVYFESLDKGALTDIHVSDLIHIIKENQPNVRYIRFIGFNDYDANKQSLFIKYQNVDSLNKTQLSTYVPEMIRVDSDSIEITEEV